MILEIFIGLQIIISALIGVNLYFDRKEKTELMKYLNTFKMSKKDLKNAQVFKKEIQKDILNMKINENPILIDGFPNITKAINNNPNGMFSSLLGNSGFLTSFVLSKAGLPADSPVNQIMSQMGIIEMAISKFGDSLFSKSKSSKDSNGKNKSKEFDSNKHFKDWALVNG